MKSIKNIYGSVAGKLLCGMTAAAAALSLAACTEIGKDERLIYVEPAEVKKHVLIEDFTGQRCVNCPNATDKIKELQETYGEENIIAVGLYGGDFGYTTIAEGHKPLSLTTADGNSYYTTWGVKAQPSGMIDRYGGQVLSNINFWTAYVKALVATEPTVAIIPTTSYDASTRSLKVDVEVAGRQTLSDAKLQVWLVEDGIVDMQYMPNGSVNNEYVHNHVFRATVSAVDGDDINVVEKGDVKKSYTVTLDNAWKPENMSVVAFVFTKDGVQQTEKVAVSK